MPQLGDRDCGDLELLVGAGRHPFFELERSPLAPNDDVGGKNYRHLLAGALRILRAARRSRCQAMQALASLSGRSTLARARQNRGLHKPSRCLAQLNAVLKRGAVLSIKTSYFKKVPDFRKVKPRFR